MGGTGYGCQGNCLKDKEFIPDIKKLLNDENARVRKSAEQALKNLGVSDEEIQKAKEGK